MVAADFREAVVRLVSIVHLAQRKGIRTHRERVEVQSLHALILGESGLNSRRACRKALIRQADPHASLRRTELIVKARETDPRLVHSGRTEADRVAQDKQLRKAIRERIEAWHRCSAESARVGIVLVVLVREIVSAKGAAFFGGEIDAHGTLAIVEPVLFRAGGEQTRTQTGRWDVF